MEVNELFVLAKMPRRLTTPAVVSSILVLPFLILELVTRRSYDEVFPIPLFALLWLLPLSFTIVVMPILRALPGGATSGLPRLRLIPRLLLLILIAWLWLGIVVDQMPCFLGVLNCD